MIRTVDLMNESLFANVGRREIFGCRKHNLSCTKRIPEVGIEYFECRSSQAFRLHSMVDISSPPFACDYSPSLPDLILIAQEDGLVHLYDTLLEGSQAFVQDYEAHANAVFDVKWLTTGMAFLTASGDQSIRLIDAEQGVITQQFFGHTMSVRSLALMPNDSQIFASASRDGCIRLWDLRLKSDTVNFRGVPGTSSVGLLSQCHLPNWSSSTESGSPARRPRTPSRRSSSDAQSVTSVVFMNDNTLLSAGSTDGSIKMWDLRKLFSFNSQKKAKPKSVLRYRGVSQKRSGYSDLQLNSLRTRLYANCLDNIVYEYDLTRPSTSPIFVYTGHQTDSFYIKLDVSPDDNYIVCGSSDRRAHIYAVGLRKQCPVVLSGHNGEVSVPRWCRVDPTRIVTLSDDSRAFVWNMFPARRCLLPCPGELAGLAERLSPSKVLMSPSEQTRRILRSPRSNPPRPWLSFDPSLTTVSPSSAAARRRQSNIRCFLEMVSPPLSSKSTTAQPSHPQTSSCHLRSRNVVTLTETLGGVVQRFPGFSFGQPPNQNSTTPFGCYSTGSRLKSPLNMLMKSGGFPSSESCSDQSDTENVSPKQLSLPPAPDFAEADALTQSPIICTFLSSKMKNNTPETPPPSRKRTPLALQQALFQTPPSSAADSSRKRLGPTVVSPLNPTFIDSRCLTSDRLIGKRRRLTVFDENSPSGSRYKVSSDPTTPTAVRRRRMTTIGSRMLKPITDYFKPDEL